MAASTIEISMNELPRLSSATLDLASASVSRPQYLRHETGIGHVHLGVGAFMRAHVAVYSDVVMNAEGGHWGIAGVSLRQATVKKQLQAQDGLYNVATGDGECISYRTIGSILSIDVAPENPDRIVELISNPNVHIISLTVTEKGYSIEPASGALDTSVPEIANDLVSLKAPQSTLGFLAAGLKRRSKTGAGPVTVISCDNLPDNGSRLRKALYEFIDIAVPDLWPWVESNCRFPGTMVDRIVPATAARDIDDAASVIGLNDAGLVKAEPFTQWVIENDFAGPRPAWETAGALFVDSVEPYELAKIRLLNGPHSALGYLGYLGGHEYVHDVMRSQEYVSYVRHMMEQEISPSAPEPEGMRHADYIDDVLARFRNEALNHRTWQIAMDGSQKLPQRLLNTIRQQLKKGGPIAALSLAVAAWIRYTQGSDEDGGAIDVRDPLAEAFADIAVQSQGDPDEVVSRYFAMDSIFDAELSSKARFRLTVAGQYRQLLEKGAAQTVADFLESC